MEMLLWVPLFVEICLITADVSQMYWRHAELWNVARDAVRQTVRGTMQPAEVEAYVHARISDAAVSQHLVETVGSTEVHTVRVWADSSVMSIFGTISGVFDEMAASVSMAVEPDV